MQSVPQVSWNKNLINVQLSYFTNTTLLVSFNEIEMVVKFLFVELFSCAYFSVWTHPLAHTYT